MPKGKVIKQVSETDIVKLVEMAKKELAEKKVDYITFKRSEEAEEYKILCWIRDHSPKYRSDGMEVLEKKYRNLLGSNHKS